MPRPVYDSRMLKIVPKPPIEPKAEARRRVRRHPKPAGMLSCHKCGGREVIEVRNGVLVTDGKASRGTKVLLCAACYMRGERVALL